VASTGTCPAVAATNPVFTSAPGSESGSMVRSTTMTSGGEGATSSSQSRNSGAETTSVESRSSASGTGSGSRTGTGTAVPAKQTTGAGARTVGSGSEWRLGFAIGVVLVARMAGF
jgi:hypothetical protein